MYRIGVVGLGKIAVSRHLPAIAADLAFELAAVADTAGAFPPTIAVPAFRTHRDMLSAMPDLDAVAVCTPPLMRTQIALDVLAAGCHLLLEKPPATSANDLADIGAAATAVGRVAFTAWHSQHNEAVLRARAFLVGKDVEHVTVIWTEDGEKYHPGQDWIWRAGGFGVFDAGVNGLSVLTCILPEPPFVCGAELTTAAGAETPIAAKIALGWGSFGEARGEVVLDWRPEVGERREVTVIVRGRHGAEVDCKCRAHAGGRHGPWSDSERTEYPRLYRHFAELIRAGTSEVDPAPLILALQALEVGPRRDALVPGAADDRTSRGPAGRHPCRPALGALDAVCRHSGSTCRGRPAAGWACSMRWRTGTSARRSGRCTRDPARPLEACRTGDGGWDCPDRFSRSASRNQVGETPIGYLTTWRMTLARDSLADGREPLARIANTLGYESENAFSTAFRRVVGCSPRRYARAELNDASIV